MSRSAVLEGVPVRIAAPGRRRVAPELTRDRKVTPLVRIDGGGQERPLIANTWGTLAGVTCPELSPEFCRSCYSASVERRYSSVARLAARNTEAVAALAGNLEALTEYLAEAVRRSSAEFERYRWEGLVADGGDLFRIHWDGDVSSANEARAWRRVALMFPDVALWVYTRSTRWVGLMLGVSNLAVYVSADAENVDRVRRVVRKYPTLRVAACAATHAEAAALHRSLELGRKVRKCPENARTLPLVVPMRGRGELAPGEYGRGACAACRLCVDGVVDVTFSTLHR